MSDLKYPVGSFINFCDEYYKVLENYSDHSAKVIDMGKDICRNFYFNYQGEQCVLITDEKLIKELESILAK